MTKPKKRLAYPRGRANPAQLLQRVRSGKPMGDPDASVQVSPKVKAKLRAKCAA